MVDKQEILLINRRREHEQWIKKYSIRQKGQVKEGIYYRGWCDDKLLRTTLQGDSFSRCPNQFCILPFEKISVEDGDEIQPVIGNDGKKLDVLRSKHYATNRFKCKQCDTEFCVRCKSIPYHLGRTCAQVLVCFKCACCLCAYLCVRVFFSEFICVLMFV